ncbi:Phospholipase D Active site motif [Legionella beliardensis]|uniref:Phospholipase D Active site motif n=1 Tax=Legionella beliardensis TaxID=91822 RepID=A0A378HYR9_9GAMM|nr:hypothetical protein [Legionella beliardensis]STX27681.1 Phospholipase D Active site motif [Legionella beliardensis]
MYTHNFFSVKIRPIQADIAKIRLNASSYLKDNDDTSLAKNAYKGWFSRTRAILTKLEKAENELTIYEIVSYQQQLSKHLHYIRNKDSQMHADKRKVLHRILLSLNSLITLKKKQLFQTLANLEVILAANKDYFSEEEIKHFHKQVHKIQKLFNPHHAHLRIYLNKVKSTIEHFISFIREKIAPVLPKHNKQSINVSVNKLMFILEEKLQTDCMQLLTEIKNSINTNRKNKLFIHFAKNHKQLLAISPGNPAKSHQLYLFIKAFLEDLKDHIDKATTAKSRQIYVSQYNVLIKLFKKVQRNNIYYLDDKHFDELENTRFEIEALEIKPAHAPPRQGNEIIHFLNAYEDISAPQAQLKGAFPSIMRSIQNAKYLICVAGWEINLHLDYLQPTLKTAEEHEKSPYTLGKVLVQKAIDNPNLVIAIKVWAQFWDNKLTYHHDSIAYLDAIAKEKGLKNGLADLPNLQFRAVNHTRNFNTHHTKAVITDAEFTLNDGTKKRKLTAFYGGLDLSRDRMDDFRHSNQRAANAYGWRDTHQQVIGPVVADMLNDFASAWHNANNGVLKFWNKWTKDKYNYCSFARFCRNIGNTQLLNYTKLSSPNSLWQSQLLRSTMSVSHSSFWAAAKPYEKSIAIGYKDAIAEAQHVIELESQYLIGGPGIHAKPEHAAFNPIPQALVDKIVERFNANEPFHVFVTLPMLPNANSAPGKLEMDSIRALQWLTIKWIMNEIEQRTQQPWWHFISFNFLAQWHGQTPEYKQLASQEGIDRNKLIEAAQRSPIYVHSKFLRVDNHLMICGSANANERSMRGDGGDSELAIISRPEPGYEEACQEQIIAQRTHNYRVTLGEEFVKTYPESVIHPERYAQQIRQQALSNFKHFHSNKESLSNNPTASILATWPFVYSKELGHVGEYQPGYSNLIDTPKGEEEEDFYQWHPEHFPETLHALAKLDIRLAY